MEHFPSYTTQLNSKKMVMLLGLLDLSAAFDTVEHQIGSDRLIIEYDLGGPVLRWFKLYL